MSYAQNTTVPVDRSKSEAAALIRKADGDLVSFGWLAEDVEVIGFRWQGQRYRFEVRHPKNWSDIPSRKRGPGSGGRMLLSKAIEQEIRRRWRVVVALQLKPLFELAAEDIDAAKRTALAHLVLPGGETVAESFVLQLAAGDVPNAEGKVIPLHGGKRRSS